MEQEELEEKLLKVFGHTADELNCANAKTALHEIYNNDFNRNPITLLEVFVSCLTEFDLSELKKVVAV